MRLTPSEHSSIKRKLRDSSLERLCTLPMSPAASTQSRVMTFRHVSGAADPAAYGWFLKQFPVQELY